MKEEVKNWEKKPADVQDVLQSDVNLAPITVTKEPVDALKLRRQLMAKAASNYLNTSTVGDFSLYPLNERMTCFIRTPKAYVKSRKVGGTSIPYVESSYAQKVLNFIFNFQVSTEVMNEKLIEEKVAGKTAHLGAVTVKFTFYDERTNREIIRMVRSSHRAYANNATTPDDAIKSAISKAWTVAGRTFGLFGDIKEEQAYQKIEADVETGEIAQPPKKDFSGF